MLSASGFGSTVRVKGRKPTLADQDLDQDQDDSSNPWLQHLESTTTSEGKISRKKNTVLVSKDSASVDKSIDALKKRKEKGEDEREKKVEDARIDIDLGETMIASEVEGEGNKEEKGEKKRKERHKKKNKAGQPQSQNSPTKPPGSSKPAKPSTQDPTFNDSDSDSNSELELQERTLSIKNKKQVSAIVFQQRELVARAFAGDDVVKEFEEEKQREEEEDKPKVIDLTIPGWVSSSLTIK